MAAGVTFGVRSQEDDSDIPVYEAAVGSTELTSPESDTNGHPPGFVDSGSYYLHSATAAFVDQDFEAVTARDLGGRELGYAELTANAESTTTSSPGDLVPELELLDVEVGVRPIIVEAGCYSAANSSTGGASMGVFEGTTLLNGCAMAQDANQGVPMYCRARLDPSVGLHDYSVRIWRIGGAGSAIFVATALLPFWLQVRTC